MPEGPEVTIITEGLNKLLYNCIIQSFKIEPKSRYYNKLPNGYNEFNKNIQSSNITVKLIANKGKFIYWKFSNGCILFQTLGMSGGWFHQKNNNTCIILTYIKNNKSYNLYYDDQRRFGTLKFFNDNTIAINELNKKLKSIGPDLLNDNTFNKHDFIKLIRNPKLEHKNITYVITNQKIISGIGNYLKCESLYLAKINPHKLIKDISDNELIKLFDAMKAKIISSYNVGGASIKNYSDINNKKGEFKYKMEIYGRKIDDLGNKIITEKIGNDTQNTYWVPNLQK